MVCRIQYTKLVALCLLCMLALAGVADAIRTITVRTTTFAGQPISDATVTITPLRSTYGPLEGLRLFLGISTSTVANATMSGTTDVRGTVTFFIAESVAYQIRASKPNAIDKTEVISPESESSVLVLQDTDIARAFFSRQATNISRARNVAVAVNTQTIDAAHARIIVTYTDSTRQPSKTFFNLTGGASIPPQSVQVNIPTGSHAHMFNVDTTACQHYTIRVCDLPSPDNPMPVDRTFEVAFTKPILAPLGLAPLLVFLVGAFLLLLTGMLFPTTSVEIGALVTCFIGWILYALGFFIYLDTQPPLGPATVPAALTFGTVIAILALIRLRERKEGLA